MDMIERLEIIAKMEGINPKEFNLVGARNFIEENKTEPECQFQLELVYDSQNILSGITLELINAFGVVKSGYTVYEISISTQTK